MKQQLPSHPAWLLPPLILILLIFSTLPAVADDNIKSETLTITGVVTSASNAVVDTDLKPNNGKVIWHAASSAKSYANTSTGSTGAQLGSGKYQFNGSVRLTKTEIPENATIKEIIIKGNCKKNQKSYTLSTSVNGQRFGESQLHSQGTTTDTQSITFTGSAIGNNIYINFSTSEAAYYNLSEITVKYTTAPTTNTISLSYSPASGVAYLNALNEFIQPTLTKTAGANITFSSENPDVATVDATGNISPVGVGTTTITASAADQTIDGLEYTGTTASYTLSVEAEKPNLISDEITIDVIENWLNNSESGYKVFIGSTSSTDIKYGGKAQKSNGIYFNSKNSGNSSNSGISNLTYKKGYIVNSIELFTYETPSTTIKDKITVTVGNTVVTLTGENQDSGNGNNGLSDLTDATSLSGTINGNKIVYEVNNSDEFKYFLVKTTGGQAFDKIVINYKESASEPVEPDPVEPDEPTKPGKPVFSPAGGVVNVGQKITISCEGAEIIVYKTDDMDEYDEYSNPITITKDITITAQGWAADGTEGPEVSASYRVKKDIPGNSYALVKDINALSDLDDILVVSQKDGEYFAMTNTTKSNKITGHVVNQVNGVITLTDEDAEVGIFNLVANEQGNAYAIKGSEGYIKAVSNSSTNTGFVTSDPYYSSVTLNDDNSIQIVIGKDGTSNRYLCGYGSNKDFRAYTSLTQSGATPVYFYKKVLMPKISIEDKDFEVYTGEDVIFEYSVTDCTNPGMSFTIYNANNIPICGGNLTQGYNIEPYKVSAVDEMVSVTINSPGEYTIAITAESSDFVKVEDTVKIKVLEKKDPNLQFTKDSYEFSVDDMETFDMSDFISTISNGEIILVSDNTDGFNIEQDDNGITVYALDKGIYTLTALQEETKEYKGAEITANVYIKYSPNLTLSHELINEDGVLTVYLEDAMKAYSNTEIAHSLNYAQDLSEDEIILSSSNVNVAAFHPGLGDDEGADIPDDVVQDDPKGKLYFLHAGETTITAEFSGNDDFWPAEVSYKLVVEHFKPNDDANFVPAPIPFNELYEVLPSSSSTTEGYTFSGSDNHHLTFEHNDPDVVVYYQDNQTKASSSGKPARVAGSTIEVNGETYTEMDEDPNAADKGVEKSYIYYPYGENPTEAELEQLRNEGINTNLKVLAVKNGNASAIHSFIINPPTGISSIEADYDAEVVYFTLQGVKVAKPTKGIYIKISGNKATKIAL